MYELHVFYGIQKAGQVGSRKKCCCAMFKICQLKSNSNVLGSIYIKRTCAVNLLSEYGFVSRAYSEIWPFVQV